jgi:hypothetical protein
MLKPDSHSDEGTEKGAEPEGTLSFEELLMLVFSGPMCFECLDEGEIEEGEVEKSPNP